jgi:hydroxyethylthiazole kinase
VDVVTDGKQVIRVSNGHPMMPYVTGLGCTATAIIGAFAAVNENMLEACANAMVVMGVAGEIAADRSAGPGSLQMHLFDVLYSLARTDINERMQVSE